jgi:hypothetical protein
VRPTTYPSPSAHDSHNGHRARERLEPADDVGADELRVPLPPAADNSRRGPRDPRRSAVTDHKEPDAGWAVPASRVPLRLLMSPSPGRGILDGAWWPQSRNFAVEFADLADNMPAGLGRPIRAVFSETGWAPAPRWINVARGRPVRAGSYPGPDTQRLLLRMGGASVLQLLVVPPELGADVAGRAMRAAASPANVMPAMTLVAEAAATAPDASRWDDDGGPPDDTADDRRRA